MKIFRIESLIRPDRGLWYTSHGVLDPLVTQIDSHLATLPMPFDKDVVGLFSGCDSIEQLREWFSPKDLHDLQNIGFELFEYVVSQSVNVGNHLLFPKKFVESRTQIDTGLIYPKIK